MKRAAFAILIHEIAIIFGLQKLIEPDDIVAGFEDIMNGKFIADVFFDLCIFSQDAIADHLYCIHFSLFYMASLKNFTVGPSSQKVSQLVFADDTSYLHFGKARSVFHEIESAKTSI
jgi:hypothetical protein